MILLKVPPKITSFDGSNPQDLDGELAVLAAREAAPLEAPRGDAAPGEPRGGVKGSFGGKIMWRTWGNHGKLREIWGNHATKRPSSSKIFSIARSFQGL